MYRVRFNLWINLAMALLLLPLFLSSCKEPKAQIREIEVTSTSSEGGIPTIPPGEPAFIKADVKATPEDLVLDYEWRTTGGKFEATSARSKSGYYYAPDKEGNYTITLVVSYKGQKLADDEIPIIVKKTETVALKPPTAVKKPGEEEELPPGEVHITSHQTREERTGLGSRVRVTGTANIPEDLYLWLVVYPHASGLYFPQSFKGGKPVGKGIKGVWSETAAIGEDNLGRGEQFDIIAVVADEQATESLSTTWKNWTKARNWPGLSELPEGVEEKARITVTRAP